MKKINLSIKELTDYQLDSFYTVLLEMHHYIVNQTVILRHKQYKLEKIIPILVENYQLALKNSIAKGEIKESWLKDIKHMTDFNEQIDTMNEFMKSSYSFFRCSYEKQEARNVYSIQELVKKFIDSWPFENEERSLIFEDKSCDFTSNLPPIFFNGILNRLFFNVIRHNKAREDKVTVKIWCEEDKYNQIILQYSDLIISEYIRSEQFRKFLFVYEENLAPDLGLCRFALLQIGGDILCEVFEEKFIQYKIILPKIIETSM